MGVPVNKIIEWVSATLLICLIKSGLLLVHEEGSISKRIGGMVGIRAQIRPTHSRNH